MERVYVIVLMTLMVMLSMGCDKKEDVISEEQYMEYMRELGLFGDDGWKTFPDPRADSLSNFLIRNTEVTGRRFKFALGRNDIIELGYPSKLYDIMLYSVHDLNNNMRMFSRSEQKEIVETFKRQKSELL